ncbi:MAG: capsular biosynthesis protein [Gammaproteobacteria bacterium]|nr:capsular biosynthesis protein [Gammaproteobacteria bacterium]MBU1723670.1 capsular biosynthesis protein [Gammaproteobacteria bacterium]MBU2004754.1 capsular biosynthesis protein [Gammaproteobacteria bacterium]
METSLEMARMAVAGGTTHLACTPHIYPGLYNNNHAGIANALTSLQAELDKRNIPLKLIIGADVHLVPEVMRGLKQGDIPTLNGSRYFLLEPSHHVPVIGFLEHIENYLDAGYVPVITHPERLRWLGDKYQDILQAARMGAWLQITAGSIAGHFGKTARLYSEKLLRDGYVHIMASDAHGVERRPPTLTEGVQHAIRILSDEAEVMRMVVERPQAILDDLEPEAVLPCIALQASSNHPESSELFPLMPNQARKSWLTRLLG